MLILLTVSALSYALGVYIGRKHFDRLTSEE